MFSNEAKRERERERESVRVWARRDGVLVAGCDVSERGHERRVEAMTLIPGFQYRPWGG